MATENQVKIVPVNLLGKTYDTLSIMAINFSIKGNKSRIQIQLDGEISTHPDTDVLSFIYAIGNENTLRNPQGNLTNIINLSGEKLPKTISYADLIKIALADANAESDIKVVLQ